MMNPLRSLLNLFRRKKPMAGDIYEFDLPDPEGWRVVIDSVDRHQVFYKYCEDKGQMIVSMPIDHFLGIYRKADQ